MAASQRKKSRSPGARSLTLRRFTWGSPAGGCHLLHSGQHQLTDIRSALVNNNYLAPLLTNLTNQATQTHPSLDPTLHPCPRESTRVGSARFPLFTRLYESLQVHESRSPTSP